MFNLTSLLKKSLLAILLVFSGFCLRAADGGVTVNVNGAPLQEIFRIIEQLTD